MGKRKIIQRKILKPRETPTLYSRSKAKGRSQQIEVMDATKPNRWKVPGGIDRSECSITAMDAISQVMRLNARNSDVVLGTVILASLANSYIEGWAGFIGAVGG